MSINVPSILFLGVCERAHDAYDIGDQTSKTNILGLKRHIAVSHVPCTLVGLKYVFAFRIGEILPDPFDVRFEYMGKLVGGLKLHFETVEREISSRPMHAQTKLILTDSWCLHFVDISDQHLFLHEGPHTATLATGDVIGAIYIATPRFTAPLEQSEIDAIRSNPAATKSIKLDINCKHCGDSIRTYCSISEDTRDLESEGYRPSTLLPDEFRCTCGESVVPLDNLRRNFHGALRNVRRDNNVALARLYERSAIEDILKRFRKLITEKHVEEIYQKFLEENKICFALFTPSRLWLKPSILGKFNADFALLDSRNDLLLIEIEKPHTKILKRNGGMHSELQAAFDQARDWLTIVDDHKLAVLDCLKVERSDVNLIRSIVIAGSDVGNVPDHLRALKSHDHHRIRFMTFDDVVRSVKTTLSTINES